MKFGVIIFPGSNCDHDAYWTIQQVAKQPVTFLWHESQRSGELRRHHRPWGIRVRRLSAYRRDCEVFSCDGISASICRRRRTGVGNLQRLSDSMRIRTVAGRTDAQHRAEICLQAGAGAGGECCHSLYATRVRKAKC